MTWRDKLKVHPACEVFPMMTEEELQGLAEDIRVHGIREPVVRWTDENSVTWLIDGRNRLEACERVSVEVKFKDFFLDDIDPEEYVRSANILRRHLTREQRRELTAWFIRRHSEKSNVAISKMAKVSDHTVASVRSQLANVEKPNEINDDQPDVDDVTTDPPKEEKPAARIDTKGRKQPVKRRKRWKPTKKEEAWLETVRHKDTKFVKPEPPPPPPILEELELVSDLKKIRDILAKHKDKEFEFPESSKPFINELLTGIVGVCSKILQKAPATAPTKSHLRIVS